MDLHRMRKFLKDDGKTNVEVLRLTVGAFNFWQISIASPMNIEFNETPF